MKRMSIQERMRIVNKTSDVTILEKLIFCIIEFFNKGIENKYDCSIIKTKADYHIKNRSLLLHIIARKNIKARNIKVNITIN